MLDVYPVSWESTGRNCYIFLELDKNVKIIVIQITYILANAKNKKSTIRNQNYIYIYIIYFVPLIKQSLLKINTQTRHVQKVVFIVTLNAKYTHILLIENRTSYLKKKTLVKFCCQIFFCICSFLLRKVRKFKSLVLSIATSFELQTSQHHQQNKHRYIIILSNLSY